MQDILLTGAAGFIGSSIASELVARGKHVRAIDNLSTGLVENLEHIRGKIEFIPGDIRNQALLQEACKGVDTIFHEAAVDPGEISLEDPISAREVNLDATLNLIRIAAQCNVRRFIFASSSAVYGTPLHFPMRESSPINLLSLYATHKRQCELELHDAWLSHGMETVALRYFNVFGPRQVSGSPDSGVIACFAEQMLNDDDTLNAVTIFGDGEQTRDFIYIDDVVAANMAAMSAPASNVAGQIFNVGSGQGRSIQDVARLIESVTGHRGSIRHAPARKGDILHSVADVRRAERKLGFRATTPFKDGLANTASWIQSQLLVRKSGPISVTSRAAHPRSTRANPRSISEAIDRGAFRLAYQPIFSMESNVAGAAEALLRSAEENAFFSPATLIRQAEQSGEIQTLGRWVISQACMEGAMLMTRLSREVRICVNVSQSQLEDNSFANFVADTTQRLGFQSHNLEIEITENVLSENPTRVKRTLHALREMGVSIALDDFGTGYAQVLQLCQLNVQRLKIDRSILHARGSFSSVFPALCGFAKSLHLPVVVEGVESKAQLLRAREAGCDECQGFFLGRPVPWEQLASLNNATLNVAYFPRQDEPANSIGTTRAPLTVR
jgi:UDP-glucose 4-epimerase